jgi:hypothetical protein
MKHGFFSLPFPCPLFGCTQAPEASTDVSQQTLAAGHEFYTVNCARCHQADGSGVKDMQPPLVADAIANPTMLICVVLPSRLHALNGENCFPYEAPIANL